MDNAKKRSVPVFDARGSRMSNNALLFGNNAAWHCALCGELNGDTALTGGEAECPQCGKRYQILPSDKNNPQGRVASVRALTMTLEQMADQLVKMRDQGEKEAALHLFGIRYDSEMEATGITPREVAAAAGLKSHFGTEIGKGRKLANWVKIVRPL